MEQNEEAAEAMAPAPVVRQLDFTVNFKAPVSTNANANANGNLILPEHPQAQLQSKLMALAQSQQVHTRAQSQSPPRMVAQTQLPPRKMVMPPKSPQRELPHVAEQAKLLAVVPRLDHPAQPVPVPVPVPVPKPALRPLLTMESPKSRERYSQEHNDGTPKKKKQCKCRNSRCLKLYCECFAIGVYCGDECNCINCHNKIEYEDDRKEAADAILERNANAFKPKITSSPRGVTDGGVEHNKGCHCKKSGCLKRYCECFQANILCSSKCKCMECKNFEGSEERKAHFHPHPAHSMAIIQQAANAAINGAIGSPSKKSRNRQTVLGVAPNKKLTSQLPQFHQETCLTSDASYSPFSVHLSKPDAATVGLLKSSYRSPLTGILQSQHVKDFCTLLVEASAQSAKSLTEYGKMINGLDASKPEISVASSTEDREHNQNQQNAVGLCGNQESRDETLSFKSNDYGIQDGRPLSPGTLALMCDEQDTAFMAAKALSTITESNTRTNMKAGSIHALDQLYAEQEKLVLTRFQSCLNRIITCGSIEETKLEREAN